jgi:hypothetical protein
LSRDFPNRIVGTEEGMEERFGGVLIRPFLDEKTRN